MDFNGSVANLLVWSGNLCETFLCNVYLPSYSLSALRIHTILSVFHFSPCLPTADPGSSKTASECKVYNYINKYTIGGREARREGKE